MSKTLRILKTLKRVREIECELESLMYKTKSLKDESDMLYIASELAIEHQDLETLNYIKERMPQIADILKLSIQEKIPLSKELESIINSKLFDEVKSDNAMFNFSKN